MKNGIHSSKLKALLALALFGAISGFALPGYVWTQQFSHRASTQAATNSGWTFTGSLNTARYSHSATLLKSGKVLVAGGAVVLSATAAAPRIRAVSMSPARRYTTRKPGRGPIQAASTVPARTHTATLLENGQVLAAEGYSDVYKAR